MVQPSGRFLGPRGISGPAETQNSSTSLGAILSQLENRLRGRGASGTPLHLRPALDNLRDETNPQIFFNDLLVLSREEIRARRPENAAPILDFLSSHPQPGLSIPASIQTQAAEELAVLRGEGPLGRRLEYLGGNFLDEVTAPGPLLAMGLAAPLYSFTRGRVLAGLFQRPAGLLTRGLGARALSSGAGLIPEVGTFWGVNRVYQQAFHPETLRNHTNLAQELAALTLTFGLFKINGYLFRAGAAQAFQRSDFLRQHLNPLAVQRGAGALGMYSGVLSSHYFEGRLDWRPHESLEQLLSGSLVTFLQLKTMGQLSHGLMGRRYQAWLQSLEAQTENLKPPLGPSLKALGHRLFPVRLATTPEGLTIPVEAPEVSELSRPRPLFMSGTEGEGPKGVTPPAESGLTSEQKLRNPLKNLVQIYFTQDTPNARRIEIAQELHRNWDLAEGLVRDYLKLLNDGKKPSKGELRSAFQRINISHFQGVGQMLWQEHHRFDYLVRQLKRRYEFSGEREQQELDHLIHGVEIKLMEITRVYGEAASFWGDYKGPDKGSIFTQERYPEVLKRHLAFLDQQEEYLGKNPLFTELLEGWAPIPTRDRVKSRDPEELANLIDELDIPEGTRTFFKEAIQYDPILTTHAGIPLFELIRRIHNPHGKEDSLELWRPLDEYLGALKTLRRWTSREDIQNLRRVHDTDGESTDLMKAFKERLGDRSEKFQEAKRDLNHFILAADRLRIQLAHFEPEKGLVRPVSWGEVRDQLMRLRRGRRISRETVEKILQWTEEKLEDVPNSILVGNRNQFIPGMLEVIFSESRSTAEQAKLAKFLDEVCARDDVEMMSNLAIRFSNYHFGDLGGEGNAHSTSSQASTAVQTRQEKFLSNLLATADFYIENPNFRGAYFEIVEYLGDAPRESVAVRRSQKGQVDSHRLDKAALVSPIHQQILTNLEAGHEVRLSSRGGMGIGVLQIRDGKSEKNLGITSIQERVCQREQFNFWVRKLYQQLRVGRLWQDMTKGQGTVEFKIYLPKFRSLLEKEDVVYWARDLLNELEGVNNMTLYVPKTNSAVRDVMDREQYEALTVSVQSPSTLERIMTLKSELEQTPDDVFKYLSLFRLYQTLDPLPGVFNPGLEYLARALRLFPKNKAVKTEMRKALGPVYTDMVNARWNKLSDFDDSDREVNVGYEVKKIWQMQQEGVLPRDISTREVLALNDEGKVATTLGSEKHFKSVEKLFALVLGQEIPLFPLERWFDLSAAGFQGENFRISYNPKVLNEISLEMDISAGQIPLPFEKMEHPKLIQAGVPNSMLPSKGSFELKFSKGWDGSLTLSVPRLRLPFEWQMGAAGTLLIHRLITLGNSLGAEALEFKEVFAQGKLALLKMGGQIKQEGLWNIFRDGFPEFVEEHAAESGLWGMDTTPATQVTNPQQIVYAYFDMMTNRLKLTPWFAMEDDGSQLTHLDPKLEVGRQYVYREPSAWMGWDVAFDLKPGSLSMQTFSQYFRHRFSLQDGEEL